MHISQNRACQKDQDSSSLFPQQHCHCSPNSMQSLYKLFRSLCLLYKAGPDRPGPLYVADRQFDSVTKLEIGFLLWLSWWNSETAQTLLNIIYSHWSCQKCCYQPKVTVTYGNIFSGNSVHGSGAHSPNWALGWSAWINRVVPIFLFSVEQAFVTCGLKNSV